MKKAKFNPQPKAKAGGSVTTIGMVPSSIGYEVYDPNNDTTQPVHVVAWLVNEESGANVTHPITTHGDAPDGWAIRYRGFTGPPLEEPAQSPTEGETHADDPAQG